MKLILLLATLMTYGCTDIFDKEEVLMGSLEIDSLNRIVLVYIGTGATTKNIIEVRKLQKNSPMLVLKKIEGFDYNYKVTLNKVNDTIVKLQFSDTTHFIGSSSEFLINVQKAEE